MIALLGPRDDPHVASLASELANIGADPYIIDHTGSARLAYSAGNDQPEAHVDDVPLDQIALAWWRVPPIGPDVGRDEESRNKRFNAAAWQAAAHTICGLLGARVVNSWDSKIFHSWKLNQIGIATAAGLKVPATMLANDHRRLVQWAQNVPRMVMMTPELAVQAPDQDFYNTSTISIHRVDLETVLRSKAEIEVAPMLYQEEVAKKHDLRVAVFGDAIFAFEINSQDFQSTELDWTNDLGMLSYKPCALPPETMAGIKSYMKKANLFEGHFDFARTPDDEIVFLECDPQGAWSWLDERLQGMISRALAHQLVEHSKRQAQRSNLN